MLPSPESSLADTTSTQTLRAPASSRAEISPSSCRHCGEALAAGAPSDFCCFGCRTVYHALRSSGLMRYYELRGASAEPVGELQLERRDHAWLGECQSAPTADGSYQVVLRAQRIRCAACVWLIEQVFAGTRGGLRIMVNPSLGRLELYVAREFDLAGFVDQIERFGYLLGPDRDAADAASSDALLLRLGLCLAFAANAMFFSAAIYFGLRQGPLYDLLHRLNFGAASLSVLVGAPVFFASAARALRRGILHLDVPIAVGIALTYSAATWAFLSDHREAAYFDSLAVFIALMLAGRFVQERLLVRNRRELLAGDEIEQLRCQRIADERVVPARCGAIAAGDTLLLAPGTLCPVDADLLDDAASCSLDWIDGELAPRSFTRGERIKAGAFNTGMRAVRVHAATGFAQSPLLRLLRSPERGAETDRGLHRFTGAYVLGVVALSSAGFGYWGLVLGQLVKGLSVATAVCVVTCPCAIGIAVPLAYDLAHARLRRAGLFVREPGFLDRMQRVRRVVFDKTGTLTTGQLQVLEPERLAALPIATRRDLYTLVARSIHPKSLALRRLLDADAAGYRPEIDVVERVGEGLEAEIDGRRHRLGKPSFAAATPGDLSEDALVYAVDGERVIAIATAEQPRPDAAVQLGLLERDGAEVFILSGDAPARVARLAAELGVAPERALGAQSPEDKTSFVRAHALSLMIGDGVNDAAALAAAHCSGTPAVDRGLIAARCDFYFTTSGLEPIRAALHTARALRRVVRTNIGLALAYNCGAVAASLAGFMQPWVAALAMPLSSIAIVVHTSLALSSRSSTWRS